MEDMSQHLSTLTWHLTPHVTHTHTNIQTQTPLVENHFPAAFLRISRFRYFSLYFLSISKHTPPNILQLLAGILAHCFASQISTDFMVTCQRPILLYETADSFVFQEC